MGKPPLARRIRDSSVVTFLAGSRPQNSKTLGELLESLRQNTLYERPGQPRYFTDGDPAIATNHTTLKTFIGSDTNANEANPAGSLTWDNLNTVIGSAFTANNDTLNDNNNEAQKKALAVINKSTLPSLSAAATSVSNNHIIARIRQEIGAGANDERILELIGVMQNPQGNANPDDNQAREILQSIKTNLGNQLKNRITTPVVRELDAKIAELQRQDNSAAKRDIADLQRIKKEVQIAKFEHGTGDNISKFKKSFDILESVRTKMVAYNTPANNIDATVNAIEIYDALLRNGDSTQKDIENAYNDAHNRLSSNPRLKSYLEELIESRENYFAQLKRYDEAKIAQKNALEVAQHLHPKENLAKAVGVSVIGVTLTTATAVLLTRELGTVIPEVKATDATVHWNASTGNSVTIKAEPAKDAEFIQPSPSEGVCIAVVCILILAATAYIAYHYYSRAKEDEDLDQTSNKNSVNIDEIDAGKSQSQIQEVRKEVSGGNFNIKKRLLKQDGHSLTQIG